MSEAVAELETPWQAMFQRLLAEPGPRAEAAEPETRLDARVYHDPQRYHAERSHLFRRLPLCLGHADQLREPGSILAREIVGLPLLLVRDAQGEIGVFLNACRHRGARLVAEDSSTCQKSSLVCPYHGWTYALDGTLVAVPLREAFPTLDRAERGLMRLPSTVRHGLIWAVLDPQLPEPDIARYLGPIDAELAAIGLGQHRFFRQNAVRRATNWKLIVDAFMEVYHVKRLHSGTIGPFFSDSIAIADHFGPHQRMLVARDQLGQLRDQPPAQWHPQLHGTMVHLIFPNTILIYHPDYVSHLGMFPTAPNETLFVHTMLTPDAPADERAKAHWDRSFDLIDRQVFHDEDLTVCEQIQRGLVSGFGQDFLLGRFESNVRRFHETVAKALGQHGAPPQTPPG